MLHCIGRGNCSFHQLTSFLPDDDDDNDQSEDDDDSNASNRSSNKGCQFGTVLVVVDIIIVKCVVVPVVGGVVSPC